MTSRDFHLHPLDPGLEPAQLLALKHVDFCICHIEFDDGDEMDMNSAELHHAIQLAQERGYASAAEDGEEGDGAMGIA